MPDFQIRIKPLEPFFFGGEKHDRSDGTPVANYFVESNLYPQQTSLLGLLRFIVLLNNNQLHQPKHSWSDLIGNKSFDYNEPNQSFGRIKKINPLYYLRDNTPFFFSPFDEGYQVHYNEGNWLLKKKNAENKFYSAKDDMPIKICDESQSEVINLSDPGGIMPSFTKSGNEKSDSGQSKEDAYYKQTFIRMDPNWCFALDAVIDDDLNGKSFTVSFGGERSLFKVSFQQKGVPQKIELSKFAIPSSLFGLYIVCDCFVSNSVLNETCFAVNRFTSFRNLQANTSNKNYAALGNGENGLKFSERYNLLTRGSMLYFDNAEKRNKVINQINNASPHCLSLGFNQYQSIN